MPLIFVIISIAQKKWDAGYPIITEDRKIPEFSNVKVRTVFRKGK